MFPEGLFSFLTHAGVCLPYRSFLFLPNNCYVACVLQKWWGSLLCFAAGGYVMWVSFLLSVLCHGRFVMAAHVWLRFAFGRGVGFE